MNTWVLIMLIGRYQAITTVKAEFHTQAKCEFAMKDIAGRHNSPSTVVLSQGCYPK